MVRKNSVGGVKKKPNQLVVLVVTIVIPVLILTKLSGEEQLGVVWGLVVALAFPVVYGLWEWYREGTTSLPAVLGLVSVLLTGGIGLLELPTQWIAIKEAAIPALLGLAVAVSIWFKHPAMKSMVGMMIDLGKVETVLQDVDGGIQQLEKLLVRLSWWVVLSFVISALLNYVLAKVIVVSPAGTEAFNQEIGKMTGLSYPVIALPVTIMLTGCMMYTLIRLQKLTGLELEEMMVRS